MECSFVVVFIVAFGVSFVAIVTMVANSGCDAVNVCCYCCGGAFGRSSFLFHSFAVDWKLLDGHRINDRAFSSQRPRTGFYHLED